MAGFERTTVGFVGGQVLAVRVAAAEIESLRKALAAGPGWHRLVCDDGTVELDLAQVAYVRVDADELRVGFGA
ncbi:MAG: hypothetical protein ABSC56_07300 [Solirubrobacteraceae bacterium]|jgi:hypothetical protein